MSALTLRRDISDETGIYSTLTADQGVFMLSTLEHAYQDEYGLWLPKIPPGVFDCVLSEHTLIHTPEPFQTYQIMVPGHTNLLFHWGNWEKDSEGCILVGLSRLKPMVCNSKAAFTKLMEFQAGAKTFPLTVLG